MKFGDIVALAKQGYTPADIKELMSSSEETKDDTPDEEEQKNGRQGGLLSIKYELRY